MDKKELRKAGLKVTVPRIKILQFLEHSKNRHHSAEEIYRHLLDAGEDVGLATVYRVLTQFETAGIVKRHNFASEHSVFELDRGEHHDHLVCVECGKVEEFLDPIIEKHQHLVAESKGFTMTDHALNIYGLCGRCQVK